MSPEIERSAENEDMQLLSRQFEALKTIYRETCGGSGVDRSSLANYDSEPIPDGKVLSSVNFSSDGNNSNGCNSNRSSVSGLSFNANDDWSDGGSNSNSNNNNSNNNSNNNNNNIIGKSIISQVQSFFKQPADHSSFDVGSLISRSMLKYNIRERNAIYEEIHGVASLCPDESEPGMVETALRDIVRELEALPAKKRPAYDRCKRDHPCSYVHTTSFRLRFLRAELFDARKAALRLALFLETVLEVYGPPALERPINLSDFSKKELKVLNAGRIQMLPYRDRGGRRVVVGIPNQIHKDYNPLTRTKIHLYMWWIASHSVETQRNGVVIIIIHNPAISDASTSPVSDQEAANTVGSGGNTNLNTPPSSSNDNNPLPSMAFAKRYVHARNGMPVRVASAHFCTPDTPYYSILLSFNTMMFGEDRARIKTHIGDDIENRYKLSGYGIPLDQLPITESGKIKTTHFKKWIQLRKNIEDPGFKLKTELESIVECPGLNDVVFRPSQSTMCHPGNVMFRSLVESKHLDHSVASSREAKIDITKSVITQVNNLGGRFLVWNNDTWWTELDDEKRIYSKIAVFFRNSKVSAKAKINRQSTRSSTYIFSDQAFNIDKRRKMNIFDEDSNRKRTGDDNPCFGIV